MRMSFSKSLKRQICVAVLGLAAASSHAQTPNPSTMPSGHAPAASSAAESEKIQQELARLRDQVARLEQRLGKSSTATADSPTSQMNSTGMTPMAMEAEDDMDMPKSGMSPGSAMPKSGMGMDMDMMKRMDKMRARMSESGMMGMAAMGGTNSPAAMAMPSALPGFPGQSHLYHIGATGFFLDHPEHIVLTTPQKQALAKKKQLSLLKQGEIQRQIDAAEQELWELTGADQPQAPDIDRKAREIERLRADQRIAYIRAVGESAKLLTEEQREQLTGAAPSQPTQSPASMPMPGKPAKPAKPDKMGHM
jgi:hypothetical protein